MYASLTTTAAFVPPQARLMRLARPLLEQLLARTSRFLETPLQFEIDSAGVAMDVWGSFSADLSAADRHLLSDGAQLRVALDLLIERALEDADPECDILALESPHRWQSSSTVRPDVDSTCSALFHSPLVYIVEWFDKFCSSLRLTHPRAIEIVRMRVEGYAARDIAGRLGMGVRLVRRLLADARADLKQAKRLD
jgi:hypothetical protein